MKKLTLYLIIGTVYILVAIRKDMPPAKVRRIRDWMADNGAAITDPQTRHDGTNEWWLACARLDQMPNVTPEKLAAIKTEIAENDKLKAARLQPGESAAATLLTWGLTNLYVNPEPVP